MFNSVTLGSFAWGAAADFVKDILLRVEVAELEPEQDTSEEGEDSHRAVVPNLLSVPRIVLSSRNETYHTSKGSAERGTKASPMAEENADMNKKMAMTIDRIDLGALEKAYSRPVTGELLEIPPQRHGLPVIDAKISEMAIKT